LASIDELAFEGKHHFIKICFGRQMEVDLDSEVVGALSFQDPSEANLLAPTPCLFLLASPNGG
jgi:hypothetical protein